MQTDVLLKRLKNSDLLRSLDTASLASLAQAASWKVYAPDAVVFWEGDTEANLYYLQYGWVKVVKTGQAFTIPRGVTHCPRAPEKTVLLMIEGAGVILTGDK